MCINGNSILITFCTPVVKDEVHPRHSHLSIKAILLGHTLDTNQMKTVFFKNKIPGKSSINNRVLQDQEGEVREQLWTKDPTNSPCNQLIYSFLSTSFFPSLCLLGRQTAAPSLSRFHLAAVRANARQLV